MQTRARYRFATALLLGSFLPNGAARAVPQTLTLDAAATKIGFVLGATLHSAEGSVKLEKGAIQFDPDTGAASGEVVIDATSATTGQASRDRNMHADVLESAQYPKIVFRADRLDVIRRDSASADVELSGVLDLHGQQRPLALPAKLRARGGLLSIETQFRVPYVDWNMRDYSNFILRVDRFVDVTVRAEGTIATP